MSRQRQPVTLKCFDRWLACHRGGPPFRLVAFASSATGNHKEHNPPGPARWRQPQGSSQPPSNGDPARKRRQLLPRVDVRFGRPEGQTVPSRHGLTRLERSAFVRLGELRPNKHAASAPFAVGDSVEPMQPGKKSRRRAQIDIVLDALDIEENHHLQAHASRKSRKAKSQAADQTTDSTSPSPATLKLPSLAHISSRLELANSDFEVWRLIKDDIFGPIASLKLDEPVADGEKPEPGRLDNIGQSFSALLSLAAGTLRRKFPVSSVQLAIVPELRRLGPTAFALGASTDLYNYMLEHNAIQNEDLVGTMEVLDEMDREVIEPDERTVALLDDFRVTIRKVRNGVYGSAINTVWMTERNRNTMRDIHARGEQCRAAVKAREKAKAAV